MKKWICGCDNILFYLGDNQIEQERLYLDPFFTHYNKFKNKISPLRFKLL